jgi:glucuronoarabinoxylan endo-1,4-beta-xylanase
MQFSRPNYVDALNAGDVIDKFDIYGGHQYGGVGTAHQKLVEKGKEIWQTEYLINWNGSSSAGRDFKWSIDAFDFAKAINLCMLSNINAWIHYAAKRYYGMLGDGANGTQNGVVTKRGYVLGHYSKYVTGATRIEDVRNDAANNLGGSSYLSVTGDSIIVVVINPSSSYYSLTVDLPFYTTTGTQVTTTETEDMTETAINMDEETRSPKVPIDALSVATLVFTKSSGQSSIVQIKDRPAVLSEEYYTLMGQRVFPGNNRLKGIYVVKSLMSDGSVSSRKIFIE